MHLLGGKPNAKYTRAYRNYCSACCDRHFCSVYVNAGIRSFLVWRCNWVRDLPDAQTQEGCRNFRHCLGRRRSRRSNDNQAFPTGSERFDHYAMGFAVGFFLFLIVLQWLAGGSGTATTVTATDESRTSTDRRDRITQFLDDDD